MVSNPVIGEVQRGHQIGKLGSHKRVWANCADCGIARWTLVRSAKDMRSKSICCARCSGRRVARRKIGKRLPIDTNRRYVFTGGYVYRRLMPDDFFAPVMSKNGYVSERRLVVAKRLGRCLQPWEIAHHKDGVKNHNTNDNLQLVQEMQHKQITNMENRFKHLEAKVEEQAKQIRLLKWQIRSSGVKID